MIHRFFWSPNISRSEEANACRTGRGRRRKATRRLATLLAKQVLQNALENRHFQKCVIRVSIHPKYSDMTVSIKSAYEEFGARFSNASKDEQQTPLLPPPPPYLMLVVTRPVKIRCVSALHVRTRTTTPHAHRVLLFVNVLRSKDSLKGVREGLVLSKHQLLEILSTFEQCAHGHRLRRRWWRGPKFLPDTGSFARKSRDVTS